MDKTAKEHYEQQQRISKLADLLVEERMENGEPFSEELCYFAWAQAKKIVEAMDA